MHEQMESQLDSILEKDRVDVVLHVQETQILLKGCHSVIVCTFWFNLIGCERKLNASILTYRPL